MGHITWWAPLFGYAVGVVIGFGVGFAFGRR